MNGVTDAAWTAFLDKAKNVGVERYVEIYQQLYDTWAG
jgi:hypothetical protein